MRIRFSVPSFGKSGPFQNISRNLPEQSFRTPTWFLFGVWTCFWTCWSNPWVSERLNLPFWFLTQDREPGVKQMYYSPGGTDVGRGVGFCGWSEANQVLMRLHDVPALLLCLRPALPHAPDLWSSTSSGSTWRAPDEEVSQLDGPQGGGNGLVSGGVISRVDCEV